MKLTNKEIQVLINALEQHQGNLDSEWSCDLNQDEYNILNRLKQKANRHQHQTQLKADDN